MKQAGGGWPSPDPAQPASAVPARAVRLSCGGDVVHGGSADGELDGLFAELRGWNLES